MFLSEGSRFGRFWRRAVFLSERLCFLSEGNFRGRCPELVGLSSSVGGQRSCHSSTSPRPTGSYKAGFSYALRWNSSHTVSTAWSRAGISVTFIVAQLHSGPLDNISTTHSRSY